jgi:hypothetical protein
MTTAMASNPKHPPGPPMTLGNYAANAGSSLREDR